MTIPAKNPNAVAEGVARLPDDHRSKRVIPGVLASWLRAAKKLDDEAIDVMLIHILENAAASPDFVHLENLGRLIGEARNGRGQAEYLAAILVKARTNRSQGIVLDVFELVALLYSDAWLFLERAPASYLVQLSAAAPASVVLALEEALRASRPLGVEGELVSSDLPPARVIRFSSTTAPGTGVQPSASAESLSRRMAHVKRLER